MSGLFFWYLPPAKFQDLKARPCTLQHGAHGALDIPAIDTIGIIVAEPAGAE